jgi:hypothetical protein
MFVPLHQVHRFSDIGYSHWPFVQQATTQNSGDRWSDLLHRRATPSARWWGTAPDGTASAIQDKDAGHVETSLRVPQYSIQATPANELQPLFGVRPIGWQGVSKVHVLSHTLSCNPLCRSSTMVG